MLIGIGYRVQGNSLTVKDSTAHISLYYNFYKALKFLISLWLGSM